MAGSVARGVGVGVTSIGVLTEEDPVTSDVVDTSAGDDVEAVFGGLTVEKSTLLATDVVVAGELVCTTVGGGYVVWAAVGGGNVVVTTVGGGNVIVASVVTSCSHSAPTKPCGQMQTTPSSTSAVPRLTMATLISPAARVSLLLPGRSIHSPPLAHGCAAQSSDASVVAAGLSAGLSVVRLVEGVGVSVGSSTLPSPLPSPL